MKPVAIIGSHIRTALFAPWDDENLDIWVFNTAVLFDFARRISQAFQIHKRELFNDNEEYIDWLKNSSVPIYMKRKYEEFPASIAYPLKEVLDLIKSVGFYGEPLEFLTSSIDYAIALAILEKRPRILLYGIELEHNRLNNYDYRYQRPGFAFWTGFAAGRGIPIDIMCADDVFDHPIYGEIRK